MMGNRTSFKDTYLVGSVVKKCDVRFCVQKFILSEKVIFPTTSLFFLPFSPYTFCQDFSFFSYSFPQTSLPFSIHIYSLLFSVIQYTSVYSGPNPKPILYNSAVISPSVDVFPIPILHTTLASFFTILKISFLLSGCLLLILPLYTALPPYHTIVQHHPYFIISSKYSCLYTPHLL